MSDQMRALLPRFDVVDEPDPVTCVIDTEEGQRSFEVQAPDEVLTDELPAEAELEVAEASVDKEGVSHAPSLDDEQFLHLQTVLDRLTSSLERVERSVHEQAENAVRNVVQQAFPKLADLFLAEEVARHIPDLVPVNQPKVTIKTASFLTDAIQESLARNGGLPENCELTACDDVTTASVDIYWEKGGASANYDAFLDSCLQALAHK